MGLPFRVALCFVLVVGTALAASKPHVVTFGKWTAVKSSTAPDESRSDDLKVRPVYVDGRLKEFTFGISHDVTDRLFVVRRVIRVNDTLPQETASTPRWTWQRGGWLVIDRVSGHISQASLPEFDPDSSSASWYRDYVAYCGVSDDGRKLYAVVAQLGRRKPILKKPLGEAAGDQASDSECAPPGWQRAPIRVSFVSKADQKFTFAVRGHTVEVVTDDDAGEGTE
ncbi:MAG TPA: hypothetical protein VN948_08370 [Terriglobales bacterium]|nr:hypothetical protein [Terriglobales bacterium]